MITIYGHQRCSWCKKAKQLAEEHSLKYIWLDTDLPTILTDLKTKKPDVKTVPQIWWDTRYVGGYEDLAMEIENTIGNYGQGEF